MKINIASIQVSHPKPNYALPIVVGFILSLCSSAVVAGDAPEASLDVKYHVVLINEIPAFRITFTNTTTNAVPIISETEVASGKQLFVELQYSDTNLAARLRSHKLPDRVAYVEADGDWTQVLALADTTLPPGGSMSWRGRDLGGAAFGTWGRSAEAIRVHVLYSSNLWASSTSSAISIIPQYVDDLPVCMTNTYFIGPQQVPMNAIYYRTTIEGHEFIFDEGRLRLCEIPPGVEPEFNWTPSNQVLRISFPGSTNATVIYNRKQWEVTTE